MRSASSLLAVVAILTVISCGTQTGDPHSDNGVPPPSGKNLRVADLRDPANPQQKDRVNTSQIVSGVVVVAVDSFNETQDDAVGTVYVQDLSVGDGGYGGITLFSPSFNPGNLRVAPGDVLDLNGLYSETPQIPSSTPVVFPVGAPLPQMNRPSATFRFEAPIPQPRDISLADLTDYKTGSRWIGMLVRVRDITLDEDATKADERNGRLAANLIPPPTRTAACSDPFPKAPELTNDLFDLGAMGLKKGTKIKSITGLVGYFCQLKLAPRSAADIEL